MGYFILFISLLFLPQAANAQDYFPTQEWREKSLENAGVQPAKFAEFRNYVFDPKAKYTTDSLVVIKDGYLIYQEYTNGYKAGQRHMLWSFSKSIVNAILGVAEKKGILSRSTRVAEYFPSLEKNKYGKDITLSHLMNMSSGIRYYEEHPATIVLSDSIFINYSWKGYKNMAEFLLKKKIVHPPGTVFNYSSGECHLAMAVLKKAINNQTTYNNFPWEEFFDKLGMRSTSLEQDFSGTFVGGSFGWSSPTDIAKLGLLYLNHGVWENEALFPRDWVDFSLTIAPPLLRTDIKEKNQMRLNQEAYGAYWWLNKKLPMNKDLPYPGLPEDMYLAMGYKGQTLAILPSYGLIIVRLGNDGLDPSTKINRGRMIKMLLDSLERKK